MRIEDLQGKRVSAFLSGGLDSNSICKWLTLHGVKVFSITADLGQPDEKNIKDIARRMKKAGAVEAIIVNGKPRLAKDMMQVIQGLGHHEGLYMNTTGIARMATVKVALPEIIRQGLNIVVHGATGRGNDQVRFELAVAHLQPKIKVYAPWHDPAFVNELGGRSQMIDFCQRHDLEVSATKEKPYSTDANMCGLTHEAGILESLETPTHAVNFIMGVKPQEAPDKEELVSISFNDGVPYSINGGKTITLVSLIMKLNLIAGRNGVGIGIDVVENRRVGVKSRGVYESPGVTLIEAAYDKLLQLVLDRNSRKLFDTISRQLADAVYEGEFFSPWASHLLAVTGNIAKTVSGTITFSLYKGNIFYIKAKDVPYSLYDADRASMEKVGEFDHTASRGYLDVAAVLARAMAKAGQIRKD